MVNILYEDQYMVAVNKPSGLLVHPSWITPPTEPTLMGLLKEQLGFDKLHTIHRLDRATSGIMLVGKDHIASQQMQAAFASREVSKTYLCMVRGKIEGEQLIDYPLLPKRDKFAEPFAKIATEPKESATYVKSLGHVELDIPVGRYSTARYSLVEAAPKTGRKHQIRRHMKHIFHPIIGDTNYGEGRHNRLFREEYGIHRMLLMSVAVDFIHPVLQERVSLKAPIDSDVAQLFQRLGWSGLIQAYL